MTDEDNTEAFDFFLEGRKNMLRSMADMLTDPNINQLGIGYPDGTIVWLKNDGEPTDFFGVKV